MQTLLKSLLATAAFLTVAPTPASALPPQCHEYCSCLTNCSSGCAMGTYVTTCGNDWPCREHCFAELSEAAASSTEEEDRLTSEPAPVCGEEQQAAEPSPRVES